MLGKIYRSTTRIPIKHTENHVSQENLIIIDAKGGLYEKAAELEKHGYTIISVPFQKNKE